MSNRKSRASKIQAPAVQAPAKKRGRPSKADKAAAQVASKPAQASSNGNHPKTLAAVVSAPTGFLLKVGDIFTQQLGSVESAQAQYLGFFEAHGDEYPERVVGMIYGPTGTQIATVQASGAVCQLDGTVIYPAPGSAEVSEELEPATAVEVSVKFLMAALTVAPKKDTRYYLNGVFLQSVGDQLRIVSTDGHRLLVITTDLTRPLTWAEEGVIIPRDSLERICKYVGKAEDAQVSISFGRKHPVMRIAEIGGIGQFALAPIDGRFPEYMRVVASAGEVLASERKPLETNAIGSDYLKAAGAIAAQLDSPHVFPFIGSGDGLPCVFTFHNQPGAMLIVMPVREDVKAALPTRIVQMVGDNGMARSLAALKAHETRCREAAKKANKVDAERLEGQANVFKARQDEIRAMLATKLTGPSVASAAAEETQEEANA